MSTRDKLNRNRKRANKRKLKALFGIVVEGETEEKYFTRFRGANVKVKIVHGRPDPESLSKQADKLVQEFKDRGDLRSGDQFWIISDKDQYNAEQIETLFTWASQRKDRSLGFSVPQFEYWILLHYEDGNGVSTQATCMSKLRDADPHYQKNDPSSVRFNEQQIRTAIDRAQRFPPLPKTYSDFTKAGLDRSGFTSVHHLVRALLEHTHISD